MKQAIRHVYTFLGFIVFFIGIRTLLVTIYGSIVFFGVAIGLVFIGLRSTKNGDKIVKKSEAYFLDLLFIILILHSLFVMPPLIRYSFEEHNLGIMNDLNDPIVQEELRTKMTQNYNFSELLDWVHSHIKWVDIGSLSNRSTNPLEILASGKGHCGEFAILYLAGCLSLGYEARWIVSVRPYSYSGLHNWVEVKVDNSWVHVDPTEKIINEPSMYQDRNWWGTIGKDAFVYAFEKGKFEDITDRYR